MSSVSWDLYALSFAAVSTKGSILGQDFHPFLGLCCGCACFQFCLDPSPSQHSCLLQFARPAQRKQSLAMPGAVAGPCLCLTQPLQDSTSWWAHSLCRAPALNPWSQTASPCCSLASTRLEKPWSACCLLGPGQDIPSSGAQHSSAALFTIDCFCPVLTSSLVLPLWNPEWLRKGLTWVTLEGWIWVILMPRSWCHWVRS